MIHSTREVGMKFANEWRKADFEDAAGGGMDSVSEQESQDYILALLMVNADEFKYGEKRRNRIGRLYLLKGQ